MGEFIRLYLTRYERWTSPLFLAGESYGTTRASALSGYLIDRGIAFNGIMLISTIMNFETTNFAPGNDIPYVLFLPSYAARSDHICLTFPERCSGAVLPKAPTEYLRQVYFDTVVFTEHQLEYLVKVFGADHIIIGTQSNNGPGYFSFKEAGVL